ncbi:MAG: hypothetical protein ACREN5_01230 [Gemmatimonadales bacterium]
MTRYGVARWLLDHGFALVPPGKDGHRHYARAGVKVTLQWHGRKDMTKKHAGLVRRQVRRLGLDLPHQLP